MNDEIKIEHSCGGKMTIQDWFLEWKKGPNDALVLIFVCEECGCKVEVRK